MMGTATVDYEVIDAIARLTINRPEARNSLNRHLTTDLLAAVRAAAEDRSVQCLLLTAAGKVFCAGGDLTGLNVDPDPDKRARQGREALEFIRDFVNPLVIELSQLEKPLVVAINGPVVGGGIGLALSGDVVVAAESARFIPKFTPAVALTPDLGYTWLLPRSIGRARTLGLSLLDESLDARRAEEWGLIWRCVPDEELMTVAMEIARKLASGPSRAQALLKAAIRQSDQNDFEQQLRTEMHFSAQCCASEDYAEAVQAYLQKRAPHFKRSHG